MALAALLAVPLTFGASGCGDSDDDDDAAAPPPAEAEDFPKPRDKTLVDLRAELGPGPVLAPSVYELEPGMNRIGFGVFDRARKQVITDRAALYVAPAGGGKVSGRFPAR